MANKQKRQTLPKNLKRKPVGPKMKESPSVPKINTNLKKKPIKKKTVSVPKKNLKPRVTLPKAVIEVPALETKRVVPLDCIESKKFNKNSLIGYLCLAAIIVITGTLIGTSLYVPVKGKTRSDKEPNCTYGEWIQNSDRYCLVSPEGKLFVSDTVKYEQKDGTCVKYVRSRKCSYED